MPSVGGSNATAILIPQVLEKASPMAPGGARVRVEPVHFHHMVAYEQSRVRPEWCAGASAHRRPPCHLKSHDSDRL